jgi:hypothetical protein
MGYGRFGMTVGDVVADKQRRQAIKDSEINLAAQRCAAMDQDGVRCNVIELTPVYVGYHSESEYGVRDDSKEFSGWVLVVLCQWHRTEYDNKKAHEYDVNGLKPEAR